MARDLSPQPGTHSHGVVQAEVQAGRSAAPMQAAAATELPTPAPQAAPSSRPGLAGEAARTSDIRGQHGLSVLSLSLCIAPLAWVQAELRRQGRQGRQGCPEAVAWGG